MSNAINIIKACPLFYEFYDAEIEKIVEKCKVVGLDPGGAVFRELEEGNELFIILNGEASVKKGDSVLAKLSTGDLFGEMVLINENIRSADIIADTRLDLLVVEYNDIFSFYESDPKIFGIMILNLCRLLAKRLKSSGAEIKRLNAILSKDEAA